MREMKDSGVAWIGVIPKDWYTCKAKFLMKSPVRTGAGAEAIQYNSAEIRYIRITDFDKFGKIDDSKKVSLPKSIGEKYLLNNGDILIATAGGTVGKSMIFSDIGEPCAYAGYLAKYDINEEKLNRYFFLYFLQSPLFANYRNGMLLKSTIENISASKYANMDTIVPLRDEQEKIVNYLRKKCSQIDTLISNQQQQIEKLKAYKQSVITETVTKGLDPDVQMKDSGYDFIGMIPASWEICKLRHIGTPQNGISKGGEFFGTGFPFVSYGDIYKNFTLPETVDGLVNTTETERKQYSVECGDIFFTRTSETIEEVGFSCVCEKTIPDATFAGFVIRVRPFNDKLLTGFAKYYFRSSHHRFYLVKEMNLVTRASLSQGLLKSMPVLVPTKEEQQEISDCLDHKCARIDKLIALKQQKIEKLQQYKKSLIYEYVTGKKEVTA